MKSMVAAFLLTIFVHFNHCQQNITDFSLHESLLDLLGLDNANNHEIVNNNTVIPDYLNDTCSLLSEANKTYSFSCVINKNSSGSWDFHRIRSWISTSDHYFKFDIKCNDFSEIVLPWPVKARNIINVKVDQCSITGFFTDYGNPLIENMKDSLQVLEIRNSVVLIGIADLLSFIENFKNLSEEYNCGNDRSLRTFVYSNITYKMKEDELGMLENGDSKSFEDDIIENGGDMIANTRSIDYKCVFQHLKTLDQSTYNVKSRYFISIQTEQSTFPQLLFYNLSNTGLTYIAKEFKTWWRFFPKLKNLDLSHNAISTIDLDSSAEAWNNYKINIDLTYNNITEIKRTDLELLGSVNNIFADIRHNPLHCVCSDHMLEVLDFLEDDTKWRALQLERYNYIKEMACYSPEALNGKQLGTINKNELACPDGEYVAVTPIVILSLTIVILIVIIVLLTKFRKEIFILTYTRFHIILPCQPAEVCNNKKYDAFVSYSNYDEEWVSKTFKDLETRNPDNYHQFKFCLHHRDFIPGKTIFDNVIDSVESSRHTVIILSGRFLQSHYCMYEFHEAFQQSIIERKRHMVVVLMENIPEEELPSDLKRCLKTFTYIRKDDSIFTDRLIYALSHKPRRDSKSSVKKTITQVHDNAGFTSEKDMTPGILTSRPPNDNAVITLNKIIPDLVIGHNDIKY